MSDNPVSGSGPLRKTGSSPGGCTADPTADELLSIESYRCGEAMVVATRRATLRPLEITGMAADFAVYASPEEALAGGSSSGSDALPAPRTS